MKKIEDPLQNDFGTFSQKVGLRPVFEKAHQDAPRPFSRCFMTSYKSYVKARQKLIFLESLMPLL